MQFFRYNPARDEPPTVQSGSAWRLWAVWFLITFGGFWSYVWLTGR